MVQPDILFKIHIFLFKFRIEPKPKIDIEEIDKKCKINDLALTKEHCDFLEYQKHLIRDVNRHNRDGSKGYEQIQPGDVVMCEIFLSIVERLRGLHNDKVNLILDDAGKKIDEIEKIKYISEEGEKYKNELPVILETILDEYWNYLKNLRVFQVEIDPDKLNVTRSNGTVKVRGTVSKPYHATTGKILFKISLRGFKEEKVDGNVKFAHGSISGAITFPQGYTSGEHVLYGYFQLDGMDPILHDLGYEAFAKTEKIPIKIISNN